MTAPVRVVFLGPRTGFPPFPVRVLPSLWRAAQTEAWEWMGLWDEWREGVLSGGAGD